MTSPKFKKILIAIIMIIWVIDPDLIPGPIDDCIAAVIAIANIRGLKEETEA